MSTSASCFKPCPVRSRCSRQAEHLIMHITVPCPAEGADPEVMPTNPPAVRCLPRPGATAPARWSPLAQARSPARPPRWTGGPRSTRAAWRRRLQGTLPASAAGRRHRHCRRRCPTHADAARPQMPKARRLGAHRCSRALARKVQLGSTGTALRLRYCSRTARSPAARRGTWLGRHRHGIPEGGLTGSWSRR